MSYQPRHRVERPARHLKSRLAAVAVGITGLTVPIVVTSTGLATAASPTTTSPWSGNLLASAASTFATGTGGWIGVATTGLTATGDVGHSGPGALALTNGGSTANYVVAQSAPSPSAGIAAPAGTRFTARVWVMAPTTSRTTSLGIVFYDTTGARITSVAGQQVVDAVGSWSQLSSVAIAPPRSAYAVLSVSAAAVAPGESLDVDDASLTKAPGGSPDVAGPLHTSGTHIVDAHGNTVVFRGFNRGGLEQDATNVPGDEEIANAKTWGANLIRVNLGEQFWLTSSCAYVANYATSIDQAVREITSRGMVALLDLHWNAVTSCGTAGEKPMADSPGSLTFWQDVATRYKDNPLVAFDLYNEPNAISDDVWLNGGTATVPGGVSYQAAGMQQLYDTVRSTGATNLVIVSGTHWAEVPSSLRVTGNNIVYGAHVYNCLDLSTCTPPSSLDPTARLDQWLPLAAEAPLLISEFGYPDPSDATYDGRVIDYAEAHGWSWVQFGWQNFASGPLNIFATAGSGVPFEPKPAGMPALAALPGLVPPTITAPTSGSLVTTSTPLVAGTATPGTTVHLAADGSDVGTALADNSGAWSVTSSPLPDGQHAFTATLTDVDGSISGPSAVVDTIINTSADIAVAVASAPTSVSAGTPATVSYSVTNAGPATASNTQLVITPPSASTAVGGTTSGGTCTGASTMTCALGALPAGTTASVTLTFTPTAAGPATVAASASSDRTDPSPANNATSITVQVSAGDGLIAFSTTRDGNAEVYSMTSTGGTPRRLTTNTKSDTRPRWSPDGTHIAFTSTRDGNAEIYVMNADGSGLRRLTTNSASDDDAAWSPDGSRIAFVSARDKNSEIYVMNADGTGPRRLTTNAATDTEPAWSPDGSRIVFSSTRDKNSEIYVMNADGTGQTRLTTNSASDTLPAWSPDGSRIAFISNRSNGSHVWTCRADGTGAVRLDATTASESDVAWAPSGTRLVVTATASSNADIYTVLSDGSGWTRLTTTTATDNQPSWQRV